MKTESKFILKNPIAVAVKGDQEYKYEITLKAPSAKVKSYVIRLRQVFLKALTSVVQGSGQSQNEDAPSEAITGAQIIALMYSGDADILLFHELMRELLLQPNIALLGDTKMTPHLYDQIELDDVEGLIGEYFADFLAPSLLKSLGN